MNWYLKVLKQYTDFSGRARRTEYWMFVLFNIILATVAMGIDKLFGLTFGGGQYGFLNVLYALAVLIPSIAVGVRRLHDIGKSGWMMLIGFIPVIGAIWLIVLFIFAGTPGENEYGANPKEV